MIKWQAVPTTEAVYWTILRQHRDEVSVFESFSDPYGDYSGGSTGEMMTVWGLKGADSPIFGAKTTWDLEYDEAIGCKTRKNQKSEYWLCKTFEVPEDD